MPDERDTADGAASPSDDAGSTEAMPAQGGPAQEIGPFKLLEKLGEGGMGEVWLAEQTEPVRRRVALKVIKRGMDTRQVIARFEAERQALALMDHPAIAKVFDAGETPRGRPYFVMEHVKGVPITEHCDRQRLTTRERLDLFLQVCEGVQHAHHKAVIHRDLKPSNVLVAIQDGKAAPKIIDFGVAKATSQRLTEKSLYTELGVLIGTPEYMSPEQAEMTGQDVDTRTDVYALGVMLYELLVGALPFDARELRQAGFAEIVRRIREEEPSKPSTRLSTLGEQSTESAKRRRTALPALRRELSGDLDWITMKALEKDRARRYGSPQELAADIRRHLDDEPVLASPPSAAYRAKKFVRRHAVGLGVAVAGVIALAAFAGTMALQAKRIADEREAAERVAEFLAGMLSDLEPNRLGGALRADLAERVRQARQGADGTDAGLDEALASLETSLSAINPTNAALRLIDEQILARAAESIRDDLEQDPLIAARLEHTLGGAYLKLGLYEQAEPHSLRAVELREQELGREHPKTLDSKSLLARLYYYQARYDEAESLQVETLQNQETVLGVEHRDTLGSMHTLAALYQRQGRYDEAESLQVETLETRKRVLGAKHPDTLVSMHNLASLYLSQGRVAEAEMLYLEVLETQMHTLGAEHPGTLATMNSLASFFQNLGRYAEAEPLYVETLEIQNRVLGAEHPSSLYSMTGLANLYLAQGRYAEAEPLFVETLETRKRVLGGEHPDTLRSMNNLAYLYSTQGRYAEAEPLYVEALETMRRVLGAEHPNTLTSMNRLADLYRIQGRLADARPLVEEFLAGLRGRAESSGDARAANEYAWAALTCEPADLRDPESALEFALIANEKTDFEISPYLDTLALAYHRIGNTPKAIETQEKALSLLPDVDTQTRAGVEQRLAEFERALTE